MSPEGQRKKPRVVYWKRKVGALTFYNHAAGQLPKVPPVVEDVPLVAEVLEDAFVAGHRLHPAPEGSGEQATYSAAVYRNDGTILPGFLELERLQPGYRKVRLKNPPIVEPRRVAAAKAIDETCIYLGELRGHFGHFLLDSLARAWYLRDHDRGARLIYHGGPSPQTLAPFARAIFAALGVDPSRIVSAREDLRVRKLIVPSLQYMEMEKASPGMCVAFDHMRESILASRPRSGGTPDKVFFSRLDLDPKTPRGKTRRSFANEEEAQAVFRKRGYEILSPEKLPFEEQVAIVAGATHVAGVAGSALHLILFNDRPDTKLIELRTKPALNQMLINSIRGVDAYHIWCAASRLSAQETVLDIDVIERAMAEIAGETAPPPVEKPAPRDRLLTRGMLSSL